jgi:hypothetical protein
MAAATKFQIFVENVAEKVHNLAADALKIMLALTAPVATNNVKADLTEIAAGNGYTAGGTAVTITTSAHTTGTYTLAGNQVVFTAAGGAIANFRYPVLYNDTPTSPADPLIMFWDYGATVTLNDTETFTVKFNNANPGTILTIA